MTDERERGVCVDIPDLIKEANEQREKAPPAIPLTELVDALKEVDLAELHYHVLDRLRDSWETQTR